MKLGKLKIDYSCDFQYICKIKLRHNSLVFHDEQFDKHMSRIHLVEALFSDFERQC